MPSNLERFDAVILEENNDVAHDNKPQGEEKWLNIVELTAENYKDFPLNTAMFWASAGTGAMGESGEISLYSVSGNMITHYHGNVHRWDRKARQWVSTHLTNDMIREAINYSKETWRCCSMGMGNVLYFRETIASVVEQLVFEMSPPEIYRNRLNIIRSTLLGN